MPIDKLTTGIRGFDVLTHGGIPEGRSTLVVGRSGAGKTIFALQVGAHFAATLVKRGPGPRTWLIGNLDQPDLLIDLLDVSGVDRRRD